VNALREIDQTWSSRGSKSRNKVSVGEPAEGSLIDHPKEKWPHFLENNAIFFATVNCLVLLY
jgi:hypothetical protein